MVEEYPPRNNFEKFIRAVYKCVDGPVTWFRETAVEPNRPKYNYYHRKFPRVPTIDQCYVGDVACFYEADEQFRRDKKVDEEIVSLLRQRRDDCRFYENPDHDAKCVGVTEDYDQAAENYFIKYGDLGIHSNVITAFMKQKHRLIWERRKREAAEKGGINI